MRELPKYHTGGVLVKCSKCKKLTTTKTTPTHCHLCEEKGFKILMGINDKVV